MITYKGVKVSKYHLLHVLYNYTYSKMQIKIRNIKGFYLFLFRLNAPIVQWIE